MIHSLLKLSNYWSFRFGVSALTFTLFFLLGYTLEDSFFDAIGFAFGTTLLLGAAMWLLAKGAEEAIDYRAMKRTNSASRKVGDWVGVAGKAVALKNTIRATLSDREALACHYQVMEEQDRMEKNQRRPLGEDDTESLYMLYEGHHLVPTGIESATGIIPLRGLPDLVNLEKSGIGHGESAVDATAEPGDPKYRTFALAEIALQEQDKIDIDWKYKDAAPHRKIIRKEWILPPEEMVCAFGIWNGQALIPNPQRPRGLPIYPGTEQEIQTRLSGGSKLFFALGVIPLLIIGWWVFSMV